MLARLLALEIAKSQLGVEEGPSNNTGARVEEYQRADNIPGERYAWCVDFGLWAWRLATGARRVKKGGKWTLVGGQSIFGGTASVAEVVRIAGLKHWIVGGKPAKGDKMCFNPGVHFTTIETVLRVLPGLLYTNTIEGNTTSYGALSKTPHNRDGVYRKRRIVRRSSVTIVRIPGQAVEVDPLARAAFNRLMPKPKPKPKPAPLPEDYRVPISTLRKRKGYWAWLAWYLGEGDWKPYGRRNAKVRPNVRKKITAAWWARGAAFLARRKK